MYSLYFFFLILPEIAEYFNLEQFQFCMQYNICFAEISTWA